MKASLTLVAALLLVCTLVACGNSNFPTTPKFLVAVDDTGAGANVNVFPINATTGALGTAVSGSPFDMGLSNAMTIVVHPNGKFFYVADTVDGSIHQWNVNETTGVPTDIAAKVVNESGAFFQPNGTTDSDSRSLVVTPNGKYLYSANGDATVGAYSIGSNGALTHIADLTITGCASGDPDGAGAITSNNTFVWVTDTCANEDDWHVNTLKIGSNGSLTQTSSVTLTGVDGWLWSIQINPAADNLLYVGDEGGNAQIFGYKVAADGSLTQLTLGGSSPQFQDDLDGTGTSSDCRVIDHSPDGKFFYWTDDDDLVHTLSVNLTTGALAEPASSPFSVSGTTVGGEGQVVVDVTGHFVYVAQDSGSSSGVLAFTRDLTTGVLTQVGATATATANGSTQAIGIVR
jgi:6-phosphogluconolactonase (cycloisomerase 2 family)